ncbi:FAD-dependent oxidoreductase [Actinomadura darangshiensis]|uniref:FAD-dependent oxidoreductase n=1 Tax=Actinomadura darangshiensis TaxID=705336 RepID=A0A4R5C3P9_9ACTN|nr:FAD-dependent oxidoreductase [Actinomadura darangshiensis]TDD92540.1 FAD-dependent oxidoreductase [Actinomadura darangshiensis]
MTQPRVVVIGAGIVGCAVADELTRRGTTDVTVLDQGPLFSTGGSTSHAPGLVFQVNPSKTMAEFARRTVEKYEALGAFDRVGGLELATTPERLDELHRRQGWATSWGIEARVLEPAECARLHPLVDAGRVLGGLHIPSDGVARAVDAAVAQARAATERGAVFHGHREVLDLRIQGGRVTAAVTADGDVPADIVVCCAGIWGPRIAAMAGVDLPLTPLAHQLAWTDPLPRLAGAEQEVGHPILRHQSAALYFRERFDRLVVGNYGHRPLPVPANELESTATLPFTEDDFAGAWRETRSLLPAAGDAKIEEGFNGLFSFTPDNLPLLGPARGVEGLWIAEAVWITHSAGVGRAVAEWLTGERPVTPPRECDIGRFEEHQRSPEYVLARDCQNYREVYDILHPLQPMEDPRPLRASPFHRREEELGAVFLEGMGWERPQWYESNAPLLDGREIREPGPWAARYWSPIAGAEAQVTRERVALYDMTSLKRIEVRGPGAEAFLREATTGAFSRGIGSVTYCLLLDEHGRVLSDITVAWLGEDTFQIGANTVLDAEWLADRAPLGVAVRDVTAGTCCIGVWGPRARDLVQPLSQDDFSAKGLRYFRARRAHIGTVPVTALRVSYVGELGWELSTTADMGLKLWDTLWDAGREHGLIAAGRGAFNSLRMEKGYRSYGVDMTAEHDPYEAGLGFAVRKEDATPAEPARRLVCLVLDDVVMGKEPVYADERPVGYVTSAAWGYTIGRGIAYAWVPSEHAEPGTALEIGYFDRRLPAVVAEEPLFDPGMERLRA